jgi:hypothetical protein
VPAAPNVSPERNGNTLGTKKSKNDQKKEQFGFPVSPACRDAMKTVLVQ